MKTSNETTETSSTKQNAFIVDRNIVLPLINLFDFIKKIPFKELTYIGVFFGGVWLYVFFNKIGYLPSFDLNSIATTLIGLAFSGIFLIIVMASFFVFPSLAIQSIHTEFLGMEGEEDSEGFKLKNKLFNYSAIWQFFTSFMLFTILMINAFFRESYTHMNTILIVLYLFLLLMIGIQAGCGRRTVLKNTAEVQEYINHNPINWGHILLFILWSYFWLVFFVLFANSIANLVRSESWVELVTIGIFAVLFGGLNFVAFYLKNKVKIAQVFVGLMLVGIFALLPIKMSILKAPFRMLSLGDVRDARIIIKPSTCEFLNVQNKGSCTYANGNKVGIVQATIVSRIGSEYLLDINSKSRSENKDNIKKMSLISIPKTDVLTWSKQKTE